MLIGQRIARLQEHIETLEEKEETLEVIAEHREEEKQEQHKKHEKLKKLFGRANAHVISEDFTNRSILKQSQENHYVDYTEIIEQKNKEKAKLETELQALRRQIEDQDRIANQLRVRSDKGDYLIVDVEKVRTQIVDTRAETKELEHSLETQTQFSNKLKTGLKNLMLKVGEMFSPHNDAALFEQIDGPYSIIKAFQVF